MANEVIAIEHVTQNVTQKVLKSSAAITNTQTTIPVKLASWQGCAIHGATTDTDMVIQVSYDNGANYFSLGSNIPGVFEQYEVAAADQVGFVIIPFCTHVRVLGGTNTNTVVWFVLWRNATRIT